MSNNTECVTNGDTLLHEAVRNRNLEVAKKCIEEGMDPNIKNNDGLTPLHIAAKSGYVELMEYLINDLTLNVRTNEGNTALYLAILHGHKEASRLLLQHGADIHIKGSDGFLPLHIAARYGYASLIKDLSDDSIINAPTPTGSTALHLAVSSNQLESVQVLVELKARINVRNNYGDTPLHIAVNCNYRDIIIYLIGHGADTNIAPKVQFKLENSDEYDYDVGYNDGYSQGLEDGKGNGDGN